MKHIVMTSGGAGSFIELDLCRKKYSSKNCIALFSDTKMEDEDLYRFLEESIKYCKVELVTLCDGRTPWQVFQDVKFIGNTRIDPCSRILKRDLLNNWVKKNYKSNECIIHFGIDYNEIHRLERARERQRPYRIESLLCETETFLSREDKIKYCLDAGIEPPRLYSLGFNHNNCGGFCVKAGLAQFKQLLVKMPERYEWHVKQESETRKRNKKAKQESETISKIMWKIYVAC